MMHTGLLTSAAADSESENEGKDKEMEGETGGLQGATVIVNSKFPHEAIFSFSRHHIAYCLAPNVARRFSYVPIHVLKRQCCSI